MSQAPHEALVRDPGSRTYNPPVAVAEPAKSLSDYAVLSENAYIGEWKKQRAEEEPRAQVLELPAVTPEAYSRSCVPDRVGPLPLPDWTMWEDFPSRGLIREALRVGLFVEVWERASSPPVVAVVFRGTEFTSFKDWISNLRWFLRFVPFYRDQYTVVSSRVGQEVVDRIAKRPDSGTVRLVSTGHSLGGGLAQHLAYSLPAGGPRVSVQEGAIRGGGRKKGKWSK